MTGPKADEAATRMGRTAGELFKATGVPGRNPFRGRKPALAAAWRRAYLEASAMPRGNRSGR